MDGRDFERRKWRNSEGEGPLELKECKEGKKMGHLGETGFMETSNS